jgi:hypothetical protein
MEHVTIDFRFEDDEPQLSKAEKIVKAAAEALAEIVPAPNFSLGLNVHTLGLNAALVQAAEQREYSRLHRNGTYWYKREFRTEADPHAYVKVVLFLAEAPPAKHTEIPAGFNANL